MTVSVTNETSEDIVSKEHPKIDTEDLDVTDTLDIDPASYQGTFLFNYIFQYFYIKPTSCFSLKQQLDQGKRLFNERF